MKKETKDITKSFVEDDKIESPVKTNNNNNENKDKGQESLSDLKEEKVEFFTVEQPKEPMQTFITMVDEPTITMTKSNLRRDSKKEPEVRSLALNFYLTNCKKFIAASDIFELKKFITKYADQVEYSQTHLDTYTEQLQGVITYFLSNDLRDILELFCKG